MMSDHSSTEELIELWLLADEGQASECQRDRLSQLIVEDAQARATIIALAQHQSSLMWHGSQVDSENANSVLLQVQELITNPNGEVVSSVGNDNLKSMVPSPPACSCSKPATISQAFATLAEPFGRLSLPTGIGASIRQGVIVFGLGVLASMICYETGFRTYSGKPDISADRDQSAMSLPAAYLTSANGCNWNGERALYAVGSGVQAGDEVALNEGIAEFRLANGVYLGIEGPASLLLASPSTLVLQHGKLTAHVPWGSDDFKVVAAGCRVTSRDGEFGISLAENKLDIHAFSGEVAAASWVASREVGQDPDDEVEDTDSKKDRFDEAVIRASRALQLTSHDGILKVTGWCKAKPSLFVSKLSMSGPLPVTQAYVDQIMSSQPIGYWRFESMANSMIRNELDAGPPLWIKDKSALVGSPENRSAELRSEGEWYLRTRRPLSLSESEYSVEAWVKPSHSHLGKIVRLTCDDEHCSQFALELQGKASGPSSQRSQALRFAQRVSKPGRATSCFSSQSYAIRRWQHVVAVKTKSRMRLYLDGKYAGSVSDDNRLPVDPILVVGADTNRNKYKYIGQIDELAIYNRALTKEEIVGHYEAVNKAAKEARPKGAPDQSVQFLKDT